GPVPAGLPAESPLRLWQPKPAMVKRRVASQARRISNMVQTLIGESSCECLPITSRCRADSVSLRPPRVPRGTSWSTVQFGTAPPPDVPMYQWILDLADEIEQAAASQGVTLPSDLAERHDYYKRNPPHA